MVPPFVIATWCHYVGHMTGKPSLHAKSSQKVLHYLLSQPVLVVKSWRTRIYSYSSASWLKICGESVIEWLNEVPHAYKQRVTDLQKLTDVDNLYELVAESIFQFMKNKNLPFPHAMYSKRHFWEVPAWKRSMVFVHLVRVVLGFKAPKQWHKYNLKDYKFNIRTFRTFHRLDRVIMEKSPSLGALPDDRNVPARKRKRLASTSPSCSEAATTVFRVDTDSE